MGLKPLIWGGPDLGWGGLVVYILEVINVISVERLKHYSTCHHVLIRLTENLFLILVLVITSIRDFSKLVR